MEPPKKAQDLAALLLEARRTGVTLETVPAELHPSDADEADLVQEALVDPLGPIVAYKVALKDTASGVWGAVYSSLFLDMPDVLPFFRPGIQAEAELAFKLGHDLPGRADGQAYGREEVEAALDGVCVAVELVESRLSGELEHQSPLLARADTLGNFGLIVGAVDGGWRRFSVARPYAALLRVSGRVMVDASLPHPSGRDPVQPVVWLANALVRRGGGLRAGQVVTTGAFGGAHPIAVGDRVEVEIETLAPVRFTVAGERPVA